MRVDDRIGAESARQAGGAVEAQRTRAAAGHGKDAEGALSGTDRLQISSLAGRIRSRFDAISGAHAARVEEVAAAVQSGRYQVDIGRLSGALASEALGEPAL